MDDRLLRLLRLVLLRPGLSSKRSSKLTEELTVKRLRPEQALTMSESTPILEACRRMAVQRVDVLVLTDSNASLCGILTARDITTRVVARELDIDNMPVSAVMTRNPVSVMWDTLAVEALEKMVREKFRHYPVEKNGKVIGILDAAECLYRAIMGKERATQHTGSNTSIETLGEPSLSTIISENSKLVTVSPSYTILMAAKTMLECRVNSVIVTLDNKRHGILKSKDLLLPVIVLGLSPYSTLVERAMNRYPISVTADVQIVNALYGIRQGNFFDLVIVDRDGNVIAVTDLHEITRAVIAAVESAAGIDKDAASSVMQKFWNSAMYPY